MIRIVTDSSCDLSAKRCRELDIDVIPLTVNFEGRSYKAGIDITNKEFFEKLSEAKELPTTSQITPGEFEQIFMEYAEQGDEVIGLFLSSKMSGTYQNAMLAKNMLNSENIHIVDTLTVTFALALLVEEAVKLRDKGTFTAAEIAGKMENLVPRVHLWAVIEDLKYLKMGGRLSPTSAFFASILGICPIITIKDGLVETVGKVRGKQAAFKYIQGLIDKEEICSDYLVEMGHSNAPEEMKKLEDFLKDSLKKRDVNFCDIGSIVGTHAGPNACGIAYIGK
jgi:EDD domain protein, DegV family